MKKFDEYFEDGFSFSEKEEAGKSRMVVLACVQQADQVNQNNRIYPKSVLDIAMQKFEREKIPRGRSYGTADHSSSLTDATHLVKRLWWDDSKLMGELLILNTSAGLTIREIIKAGGRPGISSRGKGDSKIIKKNGREVSVIQPGFSFDSFDIVSDASVKVAGVKKVVKEQKSEQEEASWEERFEVYKKKLRKEACIDEPCNLFGRGSK